MYGTVARLRLKDGMEARLEEHLKGRSGEIEGMVFEHLFRLDRGKGDYYLVVAFESEEAYRANAESPAQHERYEEYRALLEDEPRWHDGEIVASWPE